MKKIITCGLLFGFVFASVFTSPQVAQGETTALVNGHLSKKEIEYLLETAKHRKNVYDGYILLTKKIYTGDWEKTKHLTDVINNIIDNQIKSVGTSKASKSLFENKSEEEIRKQMINEINEFVAGQIQETIITEGISSIAEQLLGTLAGAASSFVLSFVGSLKTMYDFSLKSLEIFTANISLLQYKGTFSRCLSKDNPYIYQENNANKLWLLKNKIVDEIATLEYLRDNYAMVDWWKTKHEQLLITQWQAEKNYINQMLYGGFTNTSPCLVGSSLDAQNISSDSLKGLFVSLDKYFWLDESRIKKQVKYLNKPNLVLEGSVSPSSLAIKPEKITFTLSVKNEGQVGLVPPDSSTRNIRFRVYELLEGKTEPTELGYGQDFVLTLPNNGAAQQVKVTIPTANSTWGKRDYIIKVQSLWGVLEDLDPKDNEFVIKNYWIKSKSDFKPVADAGDDMTNYTGNKIAFNGKAYDTNQNGKIVFYAWDFDNNGQYDWTSSQCGNTTHAYKTVGDYTAKFTARDNDGFLGSDTRKIHIAKREGNSPPIADAGKDQTVGKGAYVTLDGSKSWDPEGGDLSYLWTEVGSGVTGGSGNQKITIKPSLGQYTFRLTVTDVEGDSSIDEVLIKVMQDQVPVVNAGPDLKVEKARAFTITGTASDPDGRITLYEWDFDGDGIFDHKVEIASTATEVSCSATHIYYTEGWQTAFLRATDNLGVTAEDSVSILVKINQGPIAVITGPKNRKATVNVPMTFDGQNSYDPDGDKIEYHWNFDDDTTKIGPQVTHKFSQSINQREVVLTIKDAFGFSSQAKTYVQVDTAPVTIYEIKDKDVTHNTAKVVWSRSKDSNFKSYLVYWYTDPNSGVADGEYILDRKTTSYVAGNETPLNPDTTYYFKIRSFTSNDWGDSNVVSIHTKKSFPDFCSCSNKITLEESPFQLQNVGTGEIITQTIVSADICNAGQELKAPYELTAELYYINILEAGGMPISGLGLPGQGQHTDIATMKITDNSDFTPWTVKKVQALAVLPESKIRVCMRIDGKNNIAEWNDDNNITCVIYNEGQIEQDQGAFSTEMNGLFVMDGSAEPEKSESSSGITPDSVFYGLDRFFEKVRLVFTINKAKKVDLFINFANERLAEAKEMVDKNKMDKAEIAVSGYQESVDAVGENLMQAKLDDENTSSISKKIVQAVIAHKTILKEIEEKASEELKEKLAFADAFSETTFSLSLHKLGDTAPQEAVKLILENEKYASDYIPVVEPKKKPEAPKSKPKPEPEPQPEADEPPAQEPEPAPMPEPEPAPVPEPEPQPEADEPPAQAPEPEPVCGDGVCEIGETQLNCCSDCGCPTHHSCQSNACVAEAYCGNEVCDEGENHEN